MSPRRKEEAHLGGVDKMRCTTSNHIKIREPANRKIPTIHKLPREKLKDQGGTGIETHAQATN